MIRYVRDDGARSDTLPPLVADAWDLDADGVAAAWGERLDATCTVFRGIRRELCSDEDIPKSGDLVESLLWGVPEGVVVALSGGVDAALLLALAARAGLRPRAVTLVTGLRGYDEAEAAQATARALGVPWRALRVSPDALVRLWPEAVARSGWPLYNLHPVARWALVRALAEEGVTDVLTGDGADARLAGRTDELYLPAVAPLLGSTGCRVRWPLARAPLGIDPGKGRLRAWAVELGVPETVAWAPKRPRLLPELDISIHVDEARLTALGARLGRLVDGPLTRWVSLDLLVRAAEVA